MISQRFLQRLHGRREFVGRLIARQPLLRRTAVGARLVQAAGIMPVRADWSALPPIEGYSPEPVAPPFAMPAEAQFAAPLPQDYPAAPQFAAPPLADRIDPPFSAPAVQEARSYDPRQLADPNRVPASMPVQPSMPRGPDSAPPSVAPAPAAPVPGPLVVPPVSMDRPAAPPGQPSATSAEPSQASAPPAQVVPPASNQARMPVSFAVPEPPQVAPPAQPVPPVNSQARMPVFIAPLGDEGAPSVSEPAPESNVSEGQTPAPAQRAPAAVSPDAPVVVPPALPSTPAPPSRPAARGQRFVEVAPEPPPEPAAAPAPPASSTMASEMAATPSLDTHVPPIEMPRQQPAPQMPDSSVLAPVPSEVAPAPIPVAPAAPPVAERSAAPAQPVPPDNVPAQVPGVEATVPAAEPATGARSAVAEAAPPATPEPPAPAPRMGMPRSARFSEGVAPTRSAASPPPARRAPEAAPSPERNAEQIFTSDTPERAPQEWARLLAEATGARTRQAAPAPEPARAQVEQAPVTQATAPGPRQAAMPQSRPAPRPAQPAQPIRPMAPPTPISEPARRFLRPLVGIDPASVRIYQDAAAGQAAASQNADALTAGDAIMLSPGHADESPATLGLLAHELTHVARQREPRFIPPVVRASHPQPASEEAIAGAVEARAIQAAQAGAALPAPAPDVPAPQLPTPSGPATAAAEWGGLPAPWEPLPEWAMSSWSAPADPAQAAPAAAAPDAAGDAPPAVAAGSGASAPVAAPAVQLAEQGRSIESPALPAAQPAPGGDQHAPQGPDLDALARQVYGVLKQRLAAERRRLG